MENAEIEEEPTPTVRTIDGEELEIFKARNMSQRNISRPNSFLSPSKFLTRAFTVSSRFCIVALDVDHERVAFLARILARRRSSHSKL